MKSLLTMLLPLLLLLFTSKTTAAPLVLPITEAEIGRLRLHGVSNHEILHLLPHIPSHSSLRSSASATYSWTRKPQHRARFNRAPSFTRVPYQDSRPSLRAAGKGGKGGGRDRSSGGGGRDRRGGGGGGGGRKWGLIKKWMGWYGVGVGRRR